MSKHTKEPWSFGEDNDGWYVEKDGMQIAFGLSESDAGRIVACVNACAGISTDLLSKAALLPEHIDARERLSEYTNSIEQQRDELLAAAKAALSAHDAIPDTITPDTSVQKMEYRLEAQRVAINKLRAAIAKSEA
jgi:hypothetical protein